jgi:hypothetical protein
LQEREGEGEPRERRLQAHPRRERQIRRHGRAAFAREIGHGFGPERAVEVAVEIGEGEG